MAHDGGAEGGPAPTRPATTVRRAAHRAGTHTRHHARRAPRRHRPGRLAALAATAALIALAGLGGLLAHDALAARAALHRAADAIGPLEQRLRTEPAGAAADLAALQADTDEAARRTSGPLWALAAGLPVVGDDVAALTTIAGAVDGLATGVLPRLSAATEALAPQHLAPRDGHVDLTAIEAVRDDVVAADRAVTAAAARIAQVPRAGLTEPLAEAADQVFDELVRVSRVTATAARAVVLIPPMLGSEGPREWLVLAQNNAEPRATGGVPGAVLRVRTDDGRVELTGTAPASAFGVFAEPVLPLTDSEEALFGPGLGRWVQDVTFTPHFPRSAALVTRMWAHRTGEEVSGVLSMDPVVLEAMIGATGPVTVTDPFGQVVTLTEQDTAEFLMATSYAAYPDSVVQDEVFALVAQAVFAALTSGEVDTARLVDVLAQAARDGRLLLWSADDDEQALLGGTVLAGELRGAAAAADGTTSPVVGTFLNLTTAGKLGYYLRTSTEVEDVQVRADGSQAFTVRVRLSNVLDPGGAEALPAYVTGDTPGQGAVRANLLVYAPDGGAVTAVSDSGGGGHTGPTQEHDGLSVVAGTVVVEPGATAERTFRIESGPDQRGAVQVRSTPGANRIGS